MTNTEAIQVLEEFARVAEESQEPVTVTPVDGEAIARGAAALREVERLRGVIASGCAACQEYAKVTGQCDSKTWTILRDAINCTVPIIPDPRDARIAELLAALRVAKIHGEAIASAAWIAGQSGGKPEWMIADFSARKTFNNAIDAALKEAQ